MFAGTISVACYCLLLFMASSCFIAWMIACKSYRSGLLALVAFVDVHALANVIDSLIFTSRQI